MPLWEFQSNNQEFISYERALFSNHNVLHGYRSGTCDDGDADGVAVLPMMITIIAI